MNEKDWKTFADYVKTRVSHIYGESDKSLKASFYEALEEAFEVFDHKEVQSPDDWKTPRNCDHKRLFAYGSYGGAFHTYENVSVCRKCGQFEVTISRHVKEPGVISNTVTFTLPTKDLVRAAGQFIRLITQEDKS